MRLQGGGPNAGFAEWLNNMSYNPSLLGQIPLPSYIHQVRDKSELCERVFPASQLSQVDGDSDFFASHAILSVRNVDLDEVNCQLLDKIFGLQETLYAVDNVQVDTVADGYEEFT